MRRKATDITLPMHHRFHAARAALPAALVALVMMLAVPVDSRAQAAEEGDRWSAWVSLGNGYVARRREPARLNQFKSERQLNRVQPQMLNLLTRKQRELSRLRDAKGAVATARIQHQISRLESRIVALSTRSAEVQRRAGQAKANSTAALWVRTGNEGLYRLTVAEMAAALGMKEKALRAQVRGGEIELTTGVGPYAELADQPVSWHFDKANDLFLFAGTLHDTAYSARNAYRVLPAGKNATLASPMAIAGGSAPAVSGGLVPFRDTLKFEEEPDLLYSLWTVKGEPDVEDYWFWDYLYGGYKDLISLNLFVPEPAVTGMAQLRVTLRGWTDLSAGDEHEVYAVLNGEMVGSSVIWDGFEEAVLVADFDQGILNPAGDNTLELRNQYTPGTHPGQWLDQVELDYERNPVAANGKLWLRDADPGTQTVTGFTSDDIIVVESPAGEAVLRNDVLITSDGPDTWSATFEVASPGSDFLVQQLGSAVTPLVTVDSGADLRGGGLSADYLVIAARDFSGTAEALVAHRGARHGSVGIAWMDDIYNQFSAGREDPLALSRFMVHLVDHLGIIPTDVTLVGKSSIDQKDRMGYSDGFLPVRFTSTPWTLSASDTRLLGYADDAPFTIGRLPITNDAEGVAYVDKLIAHESSTPGAERYTAVLVADNPDDAGEFHANFDFLAQRLLDTHAFDNVTKLYHPDDPVRSGLIDSATWNTGYITFDGHGSPERLGDFHENFINSADAAALTNESKPVFTALTCAAGDDTLPGTRSLASTLVLNPVGGAIASVAPTGLSLDDPAQVLGVALADNLFVSGYTIGQALKDAKTSTGSFVPTFMQRVYTVIGEPGIYAR